MLHNPRGLILLLQQGRGVDVAFDAAGLANGSTLNTAVHATRSLGQITNIAIHGGHVPFDLHAMYMGEKTLNGIIGKFGKAEWATE